MCAAQKYPYLEEGCYQVEGEEDRRGRRVAGLHEGYGEGKEEVAGEGDPQQDPTGLTVDARRGDDAPGTGADLLHLRLLRNAAAVGALAVRRRASRDDLGQNPDGALKR